MAIQPNLSYFAIFITFCQKTIFLNKNIFLPFISYYLFLLVIIIWSQFTILLNKTLQSVDKLFANYQQTICKVSTRNMQTFLSKFFWQLLKLPNHDSFKQKSAIGISPSLPKDDTFKQNLANCLQIVVQLTILLNKSD